jgi:hypothetical protein
MKWNWGTKLLVAMALFMSFILVLVYQSIQHDVNLVEKDYYPKGLKYQDRLDEIENARPLADAIQIYQDNSRLTLRFPEIHPDTGTVYFFRPSNRELDRIYPLEIIDNYTLSMDKSDFRKGKYVIKIHWKEEGKGYYIEKGYFFN